MVEIRNAQTADFTVRPADRQPRFAAAQSRRIIIVRNQRSYGGIRMTTMTQHSGHASGRMVLLFGIFGAHILLIYLLANGLVGKIVTQVFPDPQIRFIDPQPQRTPPPAIPAPRQLDVVPQIQPLDPLILPDEPGPTALTSPPLQSPTQRVAQVPAPNVIGLSYQATRSPDDFYPPQSLRMGEEGVAEIESCVAANGHLDGTPTLLRSSGHPRLDAAAVQWAQQALRYRPATSDGVPMRACKGFRVTFEFKGG
jgi:TonB family protein